MTKYFVIGLNKTGTTSIQYALGVALGKSLIVTQRKKMYGVDPILSFTDSLIKEGKAIFKDRPWNTGCYKELDKKYDDAKFILTIRNQEEWWTSVENWLSLKAVWGKKFNQEEKIEELDEKIRIYNSHFICRTMNKDCYIKYYNAYNNGVIEYFKNKSNLYALNVGKDFNWTNIQKITNLDEITMAINITRCNQIKNLLPDNFNGKITHLKLKDFKFVKQNENILT